jgi:signal transduction histidine kinase
MVGGVSASGSGGRPSSGARTALLGRLRRLGPGRWRDALLVLAAAVVIFPGSQGAARVQDTARPLDWLAYALLVVAIGGLAVRRTRPLATLAITVGATTTFLAIGYPFGPILFTIAIGTYSVAVRLPVRRSAAVSGLALAIALVPVILRSSGTVSEHELPWLLAWPGWMVLPWTAGTVVRLRREATQQAQAEQARRLAYEERLRVAREVHDVVGHGLAVINMQAGVALHVLDRRPEQARVALEAVKRTSKEALEELRTTLAVFRRPDANGEPAASDDERLRRPAPGLGQLAALVDTTRAAGLPVEVVVTGDPVALPAIVDHAAYRIVQESLTNVLRHALPARATVRVTYRPGEIALSITDDGQPRPAAPGPRHGIAGMRERAEAIGGELRAGPRPAGGFVVLARLPIGEPDLSAAEPAGGVEVAGVEVAGVGVAGERAGAEPAGGGQVR